MKKQIRNFIFLLLLTAVTPLPAQRYLTEVFSTATITPNVEYAQNITVITGAPAIDTLWADIYEPMGDTVGERPLILVAHTGNFLPVMANSEITGSKEDSAVVEICKQFARRGYVAAAVSYRLGWNPIGSTVEIRSGTFINAIYRGIQDVRTAARFFRKNSATYRIDTTRIALGGLGTGGMLAYGAATLDKHSELELGKFIDPVLLSSYVDTTLSGDAYGIDTRPLNIGNHPYNNSAFQTVFALGGAIPDSSWLEAGDVPMIAFQCPNDPTPYNFGAYIIPSTGAFVINVSGAGEVIPRANLLGNQSVWDGKDLSSPFTDRADLINGGNEGLFPFFRPTTEAAPWEWWDVATWNAISHPSGGTFHTHGLILNPDMSPTKALAYIDTVMGYLNPRLFCALGMFDSTLVGLPSQDLSSQLSVYPNPAKAGQIIRVHSADNPIHSLSIFDLQGRLVGEKKEINALEISLSQRTLSPGIYFLLVHTEAGTVTHKLVVDASY